MIDHYPMGTEVYSKIVPYVKMASVKASFFITSGSGGFQQVAVESFPKHGSIEKPRNDNGLC
jgi:hypothetical protein